jgi:hypothetical protein
MNTRSQWKLRHAAHFGNSTCKALTLSAVARCSLVGRVVRLWGPKGLPACQEPSSQLERRSSVRIFQGLTGFLSSILLECRSSAGILCILIESLSLSTLGEVGVPTYQDHSASIPQILSGSLCFHTPNLNNVPIIVSYPITSLTFFVHLHIIW